LLGVFALLGTVFVTALSGSASGASGGSGTHPTKPKQRHATAASGPFASRGMWIWELPASDGGNVGAIAADSRRYGLGTLTIKAGDGTSTWSQFNPGVVAALHSAGLHVCAWQYVYGNHPIAEAQIGAAAVRAGADCLAIDAESEYEGKYAQAQTYITQLRKLIGPSFPVALAGFPYIAYHPAFPYSVFLGPGGAQYNTPQMYWKDIGVTTDAVYSTTYEYNRLYGRPIDPLGQVYNSPPPGQILRFRQLSRLYGAASVSWWDWQEAGSSAWRALSQPVGSLANTSFNTSLVTVGLHGQGDFVVWAQEHLLTAGQRIAIDGSFGPKTLAAVENFQAAHGLPVTGLLDPRTWQTLLRYRPVAVRWTSKGAVAASAAHGHVLTLPLPKSASLPAKRDELAGAGGAGRPGHSRR
jgi:peptidoglycan hydrolase-like protein with peptidoglycan-binding domain